MRRAPAEVRKLDPDPIYQSVLVTQIINKVLLKGKKGAARRIVYSAMDIVEQRTGSEPLPTLKRAIDNVRPTPRGSVASRRWFHLSGPRRGAATSSTDARRPLARRVRPQAS